MDKDKLEKLYQIMANSQELGVALNDDVLSQIFFPSIPILDIMEHPSLLDFEF